MKTFSFSSFAFGIHQLLNGARKGGKQGIKQQLRTAILFSLGTAIALISMMSQATALDSIELNYGSIFQLDLPIAELEAFAETGETSDNLQLLLDVSKVDTVQAQKLLGQEIAVDNELTQRMLDSYLGEVFLKEMGSVINPAVGQEPWQDIRTALNSAAGDNSITALEVLRAYNPTTLSIDGEKAMTILGRMMSDFDDIKQLLGFNSLKDVTGSLCDPS